MAAEQEAVIHISIKEATEEVKTEVIATIKDQFNAKEQAHKQAAHEDLVKMVIMANLAVVHQDNTKKDAIQELAEAEAGTEVEAAVTEIMAFVQVEAVDQVGYSTSRVSKNLWQLIHIMLLGLC